MTDHTVTRTEVILRVANRLWRHRHDGADETPTPDTVDFFEAEEIVDEVMSWA